MFHSRTGTCSTVSQNKLKLAENCKFSFPIKHKHFAAHAESDGQVESPWKTEQHCLFGHYYNVQIQIIAFKVIHSHHLWDILY